MSFRPDCVWLIDTRKRGRKCTKRKMGMDGCDDDCPLYEKK